MHASHEKVTSAAVLLRDDIDTTDALDIDNHTWPSTRYRLITMPSDHPGTEIPPKEDLNKPCFKSHGSRASD